MNMKGRAFSRRLMELVTTRGAAKAALTWPLFSITSYRMVSGLAAQGIRPKCVLDVGANIGQFAVAAVKIFSPMVIHSFEPLSDAFAELRSNTRTLPAVTVHQYAIGSADGESRIRANKFSHSSSLLPLGSAHLNAFPFAQEAHIEPIQIRRLDSVLKTAKLPRPCLLKIDVQGFEKEVLAGARDTLLEVDFIVVELSFRELYIGEPLFEEMLHLLKSRGFSFVRPLDLVRDPRTDEALQMDALFASDAPKQRA